MLRAISSCFNSPTFLVLASAKALSYRSSRVMDALSASGSATVELGAVGVAATKRVVEVEDDDGDDAVVVVVVVLPVLDGTTRPGMVRALRDTIAKP
jgi:hypothetical protein